MWRVVCAWCRVSSYTFSCRGEWVIILSTAGFTTHIIVQPALAPQTKSCTLPQSQYTLFIVFENVVVHDGDSAQVVFQQVLDGINVSGLAYCGYFTLLARLENTKTPIINFRLYLPHNPLLSWLWVVQFAQGLWCHCTRFLSHRVVYHTLYWWLHHTYFCPTFCITTNNILHPSVFAKHTVHCNWECGGAWLR